MIKLRPHQVDAVGRMKNGCVLRGGTGSGKTLTSLVYFFEKVAGGQTPAYPGHEYKQPTNDTPIYIITTPRKRDDLDWIKEASYIPITLATVDSWNNIKKYTNIENAFFIFDETRILGFGAWTKSFLKITKSNKWILLSATPADTWIEYAPLFIANGFYRNKTHFEDEHVMYSRWTKYKQVQRYFGIQKLIRHRNDILVNMEFERETVRHHRYVTCDYDDVMYNLISRRRWNPHENQPIRDAAELCRLLRELINTDPARLAEMDKILELHRRVIVFYNFNYELDILREWSSKKNIPYAEWNGQKHEPLPDGDDWIYLCQYTAAQEAWNCTTTDCMIMYSQTYSYKALAQSCGRIDRMNTKYRDLYYYHLLTTAPIDRAIKQALAHKRDFNERAWLKI